MCNTPLLECHNITKSYKDIDVLRGVTLGVWPEKIVAIYGKSGCGKTTLLRILGLLIQSYSGTLWINGKLCNLNSIGESGMADVRKKYIGFIHRSPNLLPEWTAIENVALAAQMTMGKTKALEASRSILARMDMFCKLNSKPNQLSDGEAQRVAIARAMVRKPALILADEPTCNLDKETGTHVIEELYNLCKTCNSSLVMTTHDKSIAQIADEVYTLSDGFLAKEKGVLIN